MKYEVTIQWSDEDDAYIAEVPELPGCMADGRTPAAAFKAIERVAAEWIETATALGRPVPKPRGRDISRRAVEQAAYFLWMQRERVPGNGWRKSNPNVVGSGSSVRSRTRSKPRARRR